nr:hypothetical protein TIFTF001_053171 [Ficus carica]GMN74549.1 hypothetical protein TIFTF001_053173 [Ficus carica]
MGGTPDCFIGKPSGNIPFDIEDQVAPNAIQEVHGRFNNSIQPKSLKRLYFLDGPASVDANVEGVDGRVKRFRSLHLENNNVSQ